MRKSVGKKVRFEVFKRDSFKCQYCGASAPDVLLHVDHIKPVAGGGRNDITNLITACENCNVGKGATTLDDNSAVAKSRHQAEKLQERRQQLEMMMQWQQGLVDLEAETIKRIAAFWARHVHPFAFSEHGIAELRKLLKQFSVAELLEGIRIATAYYIRLDSTGRPTAESVETAWGKVPGVCVVKRREVDEPELQRFYYIRGIVRNRLKDRYYEHGETLRLLQAAHSWGVSLEELQEIAHTSESWRKFTSEITESIRAAKQRHG